MSSWFFPAASMGGVLVYSLDRKVSRASADDHAIRIPLRFFTQDEALAVAALASRIFPSDDLGPGAREAGVVIYIDRQLAGPYGRDRHRYTEGPFEDGPPELGYQGSATPREIYRQGLGPLLGIDRRSAVEQDNTLHEIDRTLFFELLRVSLRIENRPEPRQRLPEAALARDAVIPYVGQLRGLFGEAWNRKTSGAAMALGHSTPTERSSHDDRANLPRNPSMTLSRRSTEIDSGKGMSRL